MTTYVYSQSSYPKLLSIGKDSVVAITIDQLRTVNSMLLDRELEMSSNDRLLREFSDQQSAYYDLKRLNQLLNKRNSSLLIENADLRTLNDTNKKLNEYYKKELKVKDRKRVSAFFGGFLVGISVVTTTIILTK